MRARLNLVIVILWLLIPASALAQGRISLKTVDVQFWPEYDQPSMLVIYDFTVADQVSLPAEVLLRIPKGANLIAVASNTPEGGLVNARFDGPTVSGEWQTIAVQVETTAGYHLEYYEPLTRAGAARQFDYLWPGDYAVDEFSVYLRASVDTSSVITEPPLKPAQAGGDILAYESAIGALPAGGQFNLHINYEKSSDTLASPSQGIQPSAPVDQSTSGRVMFSNYLPYILGGLGLALIIGGSLYFWRPGGRAGGRERRHRAARRDAEPDSEIYCHQCGTRARAGDRFCRVCGSRLRHEG
jgi:hypothetical protein